MNVKRTRTTVTRTPAVSIHSAASDVHVTQDLPEQERRENVSVSVLLPLLSVICHSCYTDGVTSQLPFLHVCKQMHVSPKKI